ncbi:ankyrin [Lojkania enalia]|uniref:Ankyrin n=1 Tax=Lojkania enalia TaxID=147567 RepID=A0A9P4K142_9PLEO|nr:ankyrin [Didymosphaeria enalia]
MLLRAKADVESKDYRGQTPLSLAAANGREAVVELLLQAKANIDSKDNKGLTPLSWATANGHEAVVKLIHLCTDFGDRTSLCCVPEDDWKRCGCSELQNYLNTLGLVRRSLITGTID